MQLNQCILLESENAEMLFSSFWKLIENIA